MICAQKWNRINHALRHDYRADKESVCVREREKIRDKGGGKTWRGDSLQAVNEWMWKWWGEGRRSKRTPSGYIKSRGGCCHGEGGGGEGKTKQKHQCCQHVAKTLPPSMWRLHHRLLHPPSGGGGTRHQSCSTLPLSPSTSPPPPPLFSYPPVASDHCQRSHRPLAAWQSAPLMGLAVYFVPLGSGLAGGNYG